MARLRQQRQQRRQHCRILLALVLLHCARFGDASLCPGSSWLCDPSAPEVNLRAPDHFRVMFVTNLGPFSIQVTRSWAPYGADRFYNLVRAGYYNGNKFYRVLPDWVCQWGVNGDPSVIAAWEDQYLPDDPVVASNTMGSVAFSAMYDADRSWSTNRTTELYINYHNNSRLDAKGFAPFGVVYQGLSVVQNFYSGYGEMCSTPSGPDCAGHVIETRLYAGGNNYLDRYFPNLDTATSAFVVDDPNPSLATPGGDVSLPYLSFGSSLLLAAALICVAAVASCVMISIREANAKVLHAQPLPHFRAHVPVHEPSVEAGRHSSTDAARAVDAMPSAYVAPTADAQPSAHAPAVDTAAQLSSSSSAAEAPVFARMDGDDEDAYAAP